ncbi:manganese efflux pump, partial [Bacillus mycoides]
LFSMMLTWLGLLVGKQVQSWLGTYSEALGGIILIVFGLKLLLPI